MAHFLLVHGGWHGAWCWHKTIPFLETLGHSVTTIDLPGHGEDHTDMRLATISLRQESLISALRRFSEPPILVGHSSSGMIISSASEAAPMLIRKLVYVAAFVPCDGQSLISLSADGSQSEFITAMRFSDDGLTHTVSPDHIRSFFYHDCSEEDTQFAMSRLVSGATQPDMTTVSLTIQNYGSLTRAYIETTLDRTIPVSMQRRMIDDSGISEVYSLDSGHSPFFAKPKELANALANTSGNY